MRFIFGAACALAFVLCAHSFVRAQQVETKRKAALRRDANNEAQKTATPLAFREFFAALDLADELKPSAKLLGLNHRRVRLVGFMAQMEEPPVGAFYLCAQPVYCDEEGGGTADLPPARVRVVVRSAAQKEIAFTPRPLAVTGVLEINEAQSTIDLILDGPLPSDAPKPAKPSRATR